MLVLVGGLDGVVLIRVLSRILIAIYLLCIVLRRVSLSLNSVVVVVIAKWVKAVKLAWVATLVLARMLN